MQSWAGPIALVSAENGTGVTCRTPEGQSIGEVHVGDLIHDECILTTDAQSTVTIRFVDGMGDMLLSPGSQAHMVSEADLFGLRKWVTLKSGHLSISMAPSGALLELQAGHYRAKLGSNQTLAATLLPTGEVAWTPKQAIDVLDTRSGTRQSIAAETK